MSEVVTDEKTAVKSIYESLAGLLDYPGSDWRCVIESCGELVSGETPEIVRAFTDFREGVQALSLSDFQELYTRTFDLNPVCALEIGYHLFGENYKRGLFLANLRETEAPFNLGQEHQLPDYLPVLLRLLTKLDDEELCGALMGECLLPALAKMLKAFGEGQNPYRHLIELTRTALRLELGVSSCESVDRSPITRASLPVLTNDPRNNTNAYEITRSREFTGPKFSVASCDFVDRSLTPKLPTDPDLF